MQLLLTTKAFFTAKSLTPLTPWLAGIALAVLTALPAQAQFGTNVIVNGNAEAAAGSTDGSVVSVPGWNTSGSGFTAVQYGASGGFPLATDPGPADRGSNFFAGGPSNGYSVGTETLDLSSDAALIDGGQVSFTLSGYLGGFSSQGDNAILSATFLSANDQALGGGEIGPVTAADRGDATGLLFRSTDGVVPIGTRGVDVDLQLFRTDGSYNDGYADNLSLVLTPAAAVPEASTTVSFGLLLALGLGGVVIAKKKKAAASA